MPVITAQPIQLSTTPPYRQAGGTNFGELNPFCFKVGANLYWLAAEVQSTSGKRIGMFKRAVSAAQGTWADQPNGLDSANAPDTGSQSGRLQVFDDTAATGKIAVLYLLTDLVSLKICEFDVNTNTWGTPTAAVTVADLSNKWGFTRRSDGTYVVIGGRTGHLYYILNSGGVWGSITDTSLAASVGVLAGGLIDASDNSYILLNETGTAMSIRHLDSSNVLSSGVTITTVLATAAKRPGMCFQGPSGIAVGWVPTSGGNHGDVMVSLAPDAVTPVFTDYDVYSSHGPFLNEVHSYITPVLAADATTLNVFFVAVDNDVPLDQLMQSAFDGVSTWSAPIVYYDEITNPPLNGVTPPGNVSQFIHTLQAIELPQGWSVATAMETVNQGVPEGPPPDLWCTGEFMDPPVGTQTLELTKIVVGGPALPGDWFLSAETGSPPTGISGAGHVGPSEVDAATYELDEVAFPGITFDSETGTWQDDNHTWGGDYEAGAWDCGDATMPTPTSVIVPPGGTVACTITNTFIPTPPPPPPPGPGNGVENPVGCWELLRIDATLTPSKRLPVRGSVR